MPRRRAPRCGYVSTRCVTTGIDADGAPSQAMRTGRNPSTPRKPAKRSAAHAPAPSSSTAYTPHCACPAGPASRERYHHAASAAVRPESTTTRSMCLDNLNRRDANSARTPVPAHNTPAYIRKPSPASAHCRQDPPVQKRSWAAWVTSKRTNTSARTRATSATWPWRLEGERFRPPKCHLLGVPYAPAASLGCAVCSDSAVGSCEVAGNSCGQCRSTRPACGRAVV